MFLIRARALLYLRDLRDAEASCEKEAGLSCCEGLSLQFPIPPTDRSRDCVNSSVLWNDSDQTMRRHFVYWCVREHREQRGFYKARGTQRQTLVTRVTNCVWKWTILEVNQWGVLFLPLFCRLCSLVNIPTFDKDLKFILNILFVSNLLLKDEKTTKDESKHEKVQRWKRSLMLL